MADPVQDAVNAVDRSQIPATMAKYQGTLPNGRPFALLISGDAEDYDFLCLHTEVNKMRDQMTAARVQKAGAIALPNGGMHLVAKA